MKGRFADAVIVAAGVSRRMGGVDKLDEPLLGKPLLAWSVEAMAAATSVDRILIVTRPERVQDLESRPWLAAAGQGRAVVMGGGAVRSDSVRNGVQAAAAEIVLVHDGARPLASSLLADTVARAAAEHGAAVPVIPVVDSLKRARAGLVEQSIDREGLVRSQTPQGARRDVLLDAFRAAAGAAYSDEAALLEARGVTVATVPGEVANLKVTDPDDLVMVRALAARTRDGGIHGGGASAVRFGLGQDTHGFGPGDGLMLGGIEIAGAPRLFGHSDGDVALHAVSTAVLSACGLGDLGQLFPASDRRTTGIASAALVAAAVTRAGEAGWRVEAAQVSIVGSRPRLGAARLDQMRERIASQLGLAVGDVSVVASSGNLSGAEGAGRAISATALVSVVRR